MLSVFVIGSALIFATYAPRQTVAGFLAPTQGLAKVHAVRPGVIGELLVRDGQSVAAGDALATISVEQGFANAAGSSAPAQILEELTAREAALSESLTREQDLSHAQDGRLQAKATELRKQLAALDGEIRVLEQRIRAAEELQANTEKLRAQGFATPTEVSFRRDYVLTLQKEWYALTRTETALATELADLDLQQRQLPGHLRQRQVALQNQLSEIRQQKAALEIERTYTITAPVAGRVTALQAEIGAMAVPGQPLMAIVPEESFLEARLLVPSRAIGFVKPGQAVRMRYSSFPYEQYGMHDGIVSEVSHVSFRPDEAPSALPIAEATYRVTVRLAAQSVIVGGRAEPLHTGMLLEADLLEEPRKLWAWIFRPILAVQGKI